MAKSFDTEKITVSNTAIGFTTSILNFQTNNNKYPLQAVFSVEDAGIRVKLDGEDPTSAVGLLLNSGDTVEINGQADINRFRAIRTGGTDAVINVEYFEA